MLKSLSHAFAILMNFQSTYQSGAQTQTDRLTPLPVIVTIGATFEFSSLLSESGEDGNDCVCGVSTWMGDRLGIRSTWVQAPD